MFFSAFQVHVFKVVSLPEFYINF